MADSYTVEIIVAEVKRSAKKDWVRYTLKEKGENAPIYSAFSTGKNAVKGIEDIKQGDFVRLRCVDTTDKDDETKVYHNIQEILEHDKGKVPVETPTPSQGSKASPDRRSIERQVALKAAVELGVAQQWTWQQVIEAAEQFARWVAGEPVNRVGIQITQSDALQSASETIVNEMATDDQKLALKRLDARRVTELAHQINPNIKSYGELTKTQAQEIINTMAEEAAKK